MVVKFNKPPILEAWIEFHLDLTDESITWGKDLAEAFVDETYGSDFPKKEFQLFASGGQIHVEKGIPHVINANIEVDRIRAKTENEDYCIQAGRNILVINQIKKDNQNWPSFEVLNQKAAQAIKSYLPFRGLKAIAVTALHYRDLICIPITTEIKQNGLDLERYFRIIPNVPKDFGIMSSFSMSFELDNICSDSVAAVTIQTTKGKDKPDTLEFLMDWHFKSKCDFSQLEESTDWLTRAHDLIHEKFHQSFTQEGLNLFEPERS